MVFYVIVGVVLGILVGYGVWEAYWIKDSLHIVQIPDLPEAFEGFSILHLSDIHGRVGVFSSRAYQQWRDQADLVAVTGDLYSPTLPRRRLAEKLDELKAPSGVWYVSGNHDYRNGQLAVQPWHPGPRLLDNRVVALKKSGQTLWLAGLPDLVKGTPKWDEVLNALSEQPGPALLLAHRPDAWLLPGVQRVALILAGHTHGGQIRIPGWGAPLTHNHLPGRYAAGRLDRAGHPVLITSRGLGTSELPLRFAARPEILLIRLVKGQMGGKVDDG